MKFYLLIFFVFSMIIQSSAQCTKNKKIEKEYIMANEEVTFKDLPDGISLDDEIQVNKLNDDGEIISYEIVRVEEKLKQIGAKYVDGKLVDKNDKEIRFYKPPIRGTSQGFEEDQKQQKIDSKVLADLKEKYTLIEIFVNPLKVM